MDHLGPPACQGKNKARAFYYMEHLDIVFTHGLITHMMINVQTWDRRQNNKLY